MWILMLVSKAHISERTSRYAETASGSITNLSAGDGVRCCIERLEVRAGFGPGELHDSIPARSQALEDSAGTGDHGNRDDLDHRSPESNSGREKTELDRASGKGAHRTRNCSQAIARRSS